MIKYWLIAWMKQIIIRQISICWESSLLLYYCIVKWVITRPSFYIVKICLIADLIHKYNKSYAENVVLRRFIQSYTNQINDDSKDCDIDEYFQRYFWHLNDEDDEDWNVEKVTLNTCSVDIQYMLQDLINTSLSDSNILW